MATRKKPIEFEKSLSELEAIVASLESGDLSLEQSLKSFEQGIRLTRECQEMLQAAEQKVAVLLGSADGLESVPFEEAEDNQ